MELGSAKLRRNGINNLSNALHPHHGLIWTDGKGIFLSPVHLYNDQVENAGVQRLGEFEYVQSVHWSCSVDKDTCYMATVHQQNVTVWRVSGSVPHLTFKQVRKINVQPVLQGCLWNPVSDVLCLLSCQQCSFYFRHSQNKGSFAFPSLESEKISCGCWSPDGKKLIICVGAALLIYTWSDIEANISDFVTVAWRIPRLSGIITGVTPVSCNHIICASALPLEVLCKIQKTDVFLAPSTTGEEKHADGIFRIQGSPSIKDTLMNLQVNPQTQVQDTALLTLIKLLPELQDPVVEASIMLPGLLSPDILYFQVESQCVVVGSNTQSGLQVFALLESHLLPAGEMTLSKDHRPKGICGLQSTQAASAWGVLLLVGKPEPADPTFPSSNNLASFHLTLQFFPIRIRPEKSRLLNNGHTQTLKTRPSSVVNKSESLRESRCKTLTDSRIQTRTSSLVRDRSPQKLHLPETDHTLGAESHTTLSQLHSDHGDGPKLLIEEVNGKEAAPDLETENVEFLQSSPRFHNINLTQMYEISQKRQNPAKHNSNSKTTLKTTNTGHDSSSDTDRSLDRSQARGKHSGTCTENTEKTLSRVPYGMALTTGNKETEVTDRLGSRSSEIQNSKLFKSMSVHKTVSGDNKRVQSKEMPSSVLIGTFADDGSSICSSSNSIDSNYELLERQIQQQKDHIEALQKRIEELSGIVDETTCVFPARYQNMSEPEVVSIYCDVGDVRLSRKFLLDNGRLQLDAVKQAFGLKTVELILDGEPLVLGANVDGYIPMRFSSGSKLEVTGLPAAAPLP